MPTLERTNLGVFYGLFLSEGRRGVEGVYLNLFLNLYLFCLHLIKIIVSFAHSASRFERCHLCLSRQRQIPPTLYLIIADSQKIHKVPPDDKSNQADSIRRASEVQCLQNRRNFCFPGGREIIHDYRSLPCNPGGSATLVVPVPRCLPHSSSWCHIKMIY